MTDKLIAPAFDEESPLHGFQGDREPAAKPSIPISPSVAISREVGARGGEVARRLGAITSWPVYDAELLGYSSQDPGALENLHAELSAQAENWIEQRVELLHRRGVLGNDPTFERVSRLILALGAKGDAIFVGRGAGFILPRETTLHLRMVAPLQDRISYMSQWLRLSRDEAEAQVTVREAKRAQFLERCFHLSEDGIIYDMVLNSSALGEQLCAELILRALSCKRRNLPENRGSNG